MPDTAVYSVVLADDSADIRGLLRVRLEMTQRFRVVAEAVDGLEAIDAVVRERPDLVVLDVSMPRMGGLEALVEIRREAPDTTVLMFSGFESPELRSKAVDLGAAGFLPKSTAMSALPGQILEFLDESATPGAAVEEVDEVQQTVIAQHLERFREMFDAAAIGMVTLSLTGRVARVNRAAERLLGGDGLVGSAYADRVDPGCRSDLAEALTEVAEGKRPTAAVEHSLTGDGPTVLSTFSSVRDEQDTPLYLLLQLQDVTDLRRTEAALRDSERRFRILVESVMDYAIFMLDETGHIATWNAGAERIKGYSTGEIVGQHFRIFYTHEDQARRHPEWVLAQAERDGRYAEVGRRVRKDGSQFRAHVVLTALRDDSGALIGFAKVTRDLSIPLPDESHMGLSPSSSDEKNAGLGETPEDDEPDAGLSATGS